MAVQPKSPRPAPQPAAEVDPARLAALDAELAALDAMTIDQLRTAWLAAYRTPAPGSFTKDLLTRAIAYRLQEQVFGGLNAATARLLRTLAKPGAEAPRQVKVGSIIVREYKGVLHEVMVVPGGFCWQGQTYDSLSAIARKITGVSWNGPRFFGLRGKAAADGVDQEPAPEGKGAKPNSRVPEKQGARAGRGGGGRRSTIGAAETAGWAP